MGDSEINFIIFLSMCACASLLIGIPIYSSLRDEEANDAYKKQFTELVMIFSEINNKKYNNIYMSSDELNNLKIKANFITNQICNNYFNQKVENRIKDITNFNNIIQNM